MTKDVVMISVVWGEVAIVGVVVCIVVGVVIGIVMGVVVGVVIGIVVGVVMGAVVGVAMSLLKRTRETEIKSAILVLMEDGDG